MTAVAAVVAPTIDENLHKDLQAITRLLPYLKGLVCLVVIIGGWGVRMQYDVWGLQRDLVVESAARKKADEEADDARAKTLDNWNSWREGVTGDLREIKVLLQQFDSERAGRSPIVPRP